MSLKLVTGGANSGKTGRVVDYALRATDAGDSPTIILPTKPDVDRMRAELASRVPIGVRCVRFDSYVESCWTARGDGRRVVSPVQRRFLLDRVAESEGFGPGLASISEQVLRGIVGRLGEEWRTRAGELEGSALERLLASYAGELASRGLVELEEAALHLAKGRGFPHEPLIFHRFENLSAAQESFVYGACESGRDVMVTLTWEEGRRATSAATELVQRFLAGGCDHIALPPGEYTPSVELLRLERTLFETPRAGPHDGSIVFSSGDGSEAEDSRVAEKVAELIGSGLRPERIAIVMRDASRRASGLMREMADYGIPHDFDARFRLSRTSLGRSLSAIARYIGGGRREDLLMWLRSGYAVRDMGEVSRLERLWRRSGIDDARRVRDDVRLLDSAAGSLLVALQGPQERGGPGLDAWMELTGHMMRTRWYGRDRSSELRGDSRAYGAIAGVLRDLHELGLTKASAASLLGVLSETDVPSGEVERQGHVQVMEAERVRGRRFDAVVLMGLNDGHFPRLEPESMLSPQVRAVFENIGIEVPVRDKPAEERLLFYLVVTRARERLVLSRRSTDDDGNTVRPSPFWEETRDLYRDPLSGAGDQCEEQQDAQQPMISGRRRTRRTRARRISDSDLLAGLSTREVFSASELEGYARCPFRWFTEYGLASRPLDYKLDPARLGSLAHAAMARVYPQLMMEHDRAGLAALPTQVLRGECVSAAEAACGEIGLPTNDAQRAVDRVVPMMIRTLRSDREILPGFEPIMFERSFGLGQDDPVDLGHFSLAGRIDRIDADKRGRVVVIDYKSGDVSGYKRADTISRLRLQVPLYMAAVEAIEDLRVVGGLYRSMSTGITRGLFDPDECPDQGLVRTDRDPDLRATIEWAVSEAARAADGIRSGLVHPSDSDEHCAYCVAAHHCGGGGGR